MFAGKRESITGVHKYGFIMKLIDCKHFFGFFTGMLGRNAECYADMVLSNLSCIVTIN